MMTTFYFSVVFSFLFTTKYKYKMREIMYRFKLFLNLMLSSINSIFYTYTPYVLFLREILFKCCISIFNVILTTSNLPIPPAAHALF